MKEESRSRAPTRASTNLTNMEAAMGSVAMYLEGPSQERHPVKLASTRTVPVKPTLAHRPARGAA